MRPEHTHTKQDAELASAQYAYLARHAPGFQTRRIRWSGGATQMIEVGRGPPLLLLHGGLGEAFQWAPILAELSRKRRVLAVDRPGHGLADPFDYRKVDLLSHARDFLRDILDTEGLSSVPIVGTSMGGLWAVAFALAYPARVELLLKDRWKELRVPTTIILGDQDAFGGFDAADAAAKANARIKIVRIAEAGHAPWFDQPAEFLNVIERVL